MIKANFDGSRNYWEIKNNQKKKKKGIDNKLIAKTKDNNGLELLGR